MVSVVIRYYHPFPDAIPDSRAGYPRVTHPSAAHSNVESFDAEHQNHLRECARLACIRHAASVHPEPGSNSHVKKLISVKLNLANSFIQIESEFTVLKVFNFH